VIALLLLAGCTWAPAHLLGDAEHEDQFALAAHGHVLAGTALVATHDGVATLHALAPTGTDLFQVTVDAGGAAITSPDDDLAARLRKIPFDRDLSVLYRLRCDAPRCKAERWRLVRRPDGWRVRGPGGPATLVRDGDRWRLTDPVRGYTLTVAEGGS